MKKAFITGVTGQDGSYLAEFLLNKGYEVHAIIRRSSVFTTQRLQKEVWNNPSFFTYHGSILYFRLVKVKNIYSFCFSSLNFSLRI